MVKVIALGILLFTSCFLNAASSVEIVSNVPKFALPKKITYVENGKPLTLLENKVPFQSENIEIKLVSQKELLNSKDVIDREIKKYPKNFIENKINRIIVVAQLRVDGNNYGYYVGPNYIIIKLKSSFFGLKHDYSLLSENLHAAIGEMTLYKHHNYLMLFLFKGGEVPSKNKSYTMDDLIERGYVSKNGMTTFDRYIAEYYKLIYTDPEKIIRYALKSDNIRKRLCLAVSMYEKDDKKTLIYMTSHHITDLCHSKDDSSSISIDLSGS